MKVLEKLRIPSESEEEFPSDYDRELDDENEDGFPSEIPSDDPRRDPVPGEAPPRKPRGARPQPRTEPPRVTKKHKDEAAEEIATFLEMLALTWSWQAPECGDALEAAAPDIAAKVTRLLARNPRWLMKVREGGMLADAVGIAIALRPVVKVAWSHYSQPSGGDEANGVAFDPSQFPAYDGSGITR